MSRELVGSKFIGGHGKDVAGFYDHKAELAARKLEYLKRQEIYRKQYYKKSKLPPMIIEPFGHVRQRLPFKMTPEDRALRLQWIRDQEISPKEPRYVPELLPRNPIRRFLGAPWDMVTKLIYPLIGHEKAQLFRAVFPKVLMVYGAIALFKAYQHAPETNAHWEQKQGITRLWVRDPRMPGSDAPLTDESSPQPHNHEKHTADFVDKGFRVRKTHLLPLEHSY